MKKKLYLASAVLLCIYSNAFAKAEVNQFIKVALAQMHMSDIDEENFIKSMHLIDQAAEQQVDIITFPELQFNRFFPQYPGLNARKHALAINDPKIKAMQEKCKALGIIAIPNFYLEENGIFYDASILIDATGEILGISKMVNIPYSRFFYEKDYYAPSDTGFKVYETSKGKIGVVVCFDRHFPESIRACALQGAEYIIISTANLKGEPLELFEWEMRIAAFQNNVFVAMCNRVGVEDEMDFCGESLVAGPFGNTIFKAHDKEELVIVQINRAELTQSQKAKPFLTFLKPVAQ